jgi:hypothetical protein
MALARLASHQQAAPLKNLCLPGTGVKKNVFDILERMRSI